MTTVHLICGFLGVGKTTFSRALEAQTSGVRFSSDELYLRLFANGPTHELNPDALARLVNALNELWPRVAAAGVDVILDFGFWHRSLRDEVRRLALSIEAESRLYWLQCPDEFALERCLRRNGTAGSFLVSAEGFFGMKSRFEPPGADECAEIVDTLADGRGVQE